VSRRYIDADLPCVSDDRPTRAELAAERDGEKYDEGFRDGEDAGYEKGHRDGMADMHDAVVSKIDELMTYHYPNGVIHQGLAIARARIAEAAPDDAEVAGE
jgi:hypothetical protein